MTSAIIIIFNIVPRPGTCFIGNHKSNTNELTAAVEMPNDQENWLDTYRVKKLAKNTYQLTPKTRNEDLLEQVHNLKALSSVKQVELTLFYGDDLPKRF